MMKKGNVHEVADVETRLRYKAFAGHQPQSHEQPAKHAGVGEG